MDAKNAANESSDQPDWPQGVSLKSLVDALMYSACVQQQSNNLMIQLIGQNQQLLSLLVDDPPEDAEPRTDMEGRPIRDS